MLRPVFFSCLYVRIEARAGSPCFFFRGHECGKSDDYKGFCFKESKYPKLRARKDEKKPELAVRA